MSSTGGSHNAAISGAVQHAEESDNLRLQYWEGLTLAENQKLTKVLGRLAQRYSNLSIPKQLFGAIDPFSQEALDYYTSHHFERTPRAFYKAPKFAPEMRLSDRWELSRGSVATATFASAFVPSFPACLLSDSRCVGGGSVSVRYWKHPEGESLGTMIAIHGWQMADRRLSSVTLAPGFFYRLGLDVVVYEMPYHGLRQQSDNGAPIYFPSSDMARTAEGFAQAICELRQIRKWIQTQNDKPVGVIGLSLGGYVAALWAALDKLAAVICVSPVSDLLQFVRHYISQDGFTDTERSQIFDFLAHKGLEQAFALHSPRSYRSRVPKKDRLLLAAKYDQVVPPEHVLELWKHWGKPEIHWLEGGHFGQMFAEDAMRCLHDFLLKRGLALAVPLDIAAAPSPA